MAVWGIGAYYPNEKEDKAEVFYKKGRIILGYYEKNNPKCYEKLRSIKPCDIIFIKSRFMKNVALRIKAVGIAVSDEPCIEDGMDGREGIRVKWLKNCIEKPLEIQKGTDNDGSTTAIYQETDPEVISRIAKLII